MGLYLMAEVSCLVLVADGSEEVETISVVDALRRANIKVTLAVVGQNLQVKCSRGVHLLGDSLLVDCNSDSFDAVVLPGGLGGAQAFRDSNNVKEIVTNFLSANKLVAAICASPAVVLAHHNLLGDSKATCYPAFLDKLPNAVPDRVVVDGT